MEQEKGSGPNFGVAGMSELQEDRSYQGGGPPGAEQSNCGFPQRERHKGHLRLAALKCDLTLLLNTLICVFPPDWLTNLFFQHEGDQRAPGEKEEA